MVRRLTGRVLIVSAIVLWSVPPAVAQEPATYTGTVFPDEALPPGDFVLENSVVITITGDTVTGSFRLHGGQEGDPTCSAIVGEIEPGEVTVTEGPSGSLILSGTAVFGIFSSPGQCVPGEYGGLILPAPGQLEATIAANGEMNGNIDGEDTFPFRAFGPPTSSLGGGGVVPGSEETGEPGGVDWLPLLIGLVVLALLFARIPAGRAARRQGQTTPSTEPAVSLKPTRRIESPLSTVGRVWGSPPGTPSVAPKTSACQLAIENYKWAEAEREKSWKLFEEAVDNANRASHVLWETEQSWRQTLSHVTGAGVNVGLALGGVGLAARLLAKVLGGSAAAEAAWAASTRLGAGTSLGVNLVFNPFQNAIDSGLGTDLTHLERHAEKAALAAAAAQATYEADRKQLFRSRRIKERKCTR